MNLINQAIIVAAKAHEGQMRKATDIPYITHPFAVGMLLQKANCSDEVVAAGILHDTLEDTSTTYEDLEALFGKKIANLVQVASEQDKSLSWEERKHHTIDSLKSVNEAGLQVIVADKLHNLRSIKENLQQEGAMVWERFKRGKQKQHWYYASIVRELLQREMQFSLIEELKQEVLEVFGTLDAEDR